MKNFKEAVGIGGLITAIVCGICGVEGDKPIIIIFILFVIAAFLDEHYENK